jgi:endonuclease/exonuclease/phosphatase family metal-dependent hydrolase
MDEKQRKSLSPERGREMFYSNLRWLVKKAPERKRAITNLMALREQLQESVPSKDSEEHLLLATWNIRDFGKKNRRGWGKRLPETWFYIAEVISRFDFVAVQEVNQLDEWKKVMDILGSHWDYIATDETDSKLGGNGERMVFVYDTRKIKFQHIAGEIVLPPDMLISRVEFKEDEESKKIVAGNQFKRTPFLASFQSGWLKFDICTVHLYFGSKSGEKLEQRIEEIGAIADYLSTRADRALGEDRAMILLGDFNIVHPEHRTMQALLDNNFQVPQALQDKPTTGTEKHYDQIAFKTQPEVLEFVEQEDNAGVLPLFVKLMKDEDFEEYREYVKKSSAGKKVLKETEEGDEQEEKLRKVFKQWRTYQFSDHYPMWVRLKTNGSEEYLQRLLSELE